MTGSLVIGEIGGSSSRWALIREGSEPVTFPPKGMGLLGFNPLSGDPERFEADLREFFTGHAPEVLRAEQLHIYGAGCGTIERQERMGQVLRRLWPQASMEVLSDLMGAARGLYGSGRGLVLILGTGMNAGYYEGGILHHPLPSLGWALGDEGSGSDIGRIILQDALYRRMPEELRILLFGEDGPDLQVVLDQVYRSPLPARWVASHTVRLAGLLEVPYVRNLMLSRFHALAELLVSFFPPGQREVVSATGSVAYGFREILAECLLDRGMTLMEVEPDPLPGLVRYHHRRA